MSHRPPAPFAPSRIATAFALALLAAGPLAAQAPSPLVAKPAADPAAAAADSTVRDSTEVRAVARRHAGVVRTCYQEQALKADPTLRGLLRIELTVLPTGEVQAAAATATEVSGSGMPDVTACVSKAARLWRFSDGAPRTARVVLEYDLVPETP